MKGLKLRILIAQNSFVIDMSVITKLPAVSGRHGSALNAVKHNRIISTAMSNKLSKMCIYKLYKHLYI